MSEQTQAPEAPVEKWLQVELHYEEEDGTVRGGTLHLRALSEADTTAIEARKSNLAGVPWSHVTPTYAYLLHSAATVLQASSPAAEHRPEWLELDANSLLQRATLIVELERVVQEHTARYLQHLRHARGKPAQRSAIQVRAVGSFGRLP